MVYLFTVTAPSEASASKAKSEYSRSRYAILCDMRVTTAGEGKQVQSSTVATGGEEGRRYAVHNVHAHNTRSNTLLQQQDTTTTWRDPIVA